jgi:hypothetical protein
MQLLKQLLKKLEFGTPVDITTLVGKLGGSTYLYNRNPPGEIFWQDFAGTPATALGDPVRVNLDSNSIGKQKTAFFNGTSGTFFSTPDADGLDITGDIGFFVDAAAVSWTAVESFFGKWVSGNLSFLFRMSGGKVGVIISVNGSTVAANVTSNVNIPFSAGERGQIKAEVDVNNGAGGADFRFYARSTYGDAWTQLGPTVTHGATLTIFSGNAPGSVGAESNGVGTRFNGRIYRAQVYAGLDGTDLRADFDPSQYSSGNTFTSGGAVYTRNGQAFIAGDGTHRVTPSDATRLQLGRFPAGVGVRNLLADYGANNVNFTAAPWNASATQGTGIAPVITANYLGDSNKTRIQLDCGAGGALSDRSGFAVSNAAASFLVGRAVTYSVVIEPAGSTTLVDLQTAVATNLPIIVAHGGTPSATLTDNGSGTYTLKYNVTPSVASGQLRFQITGNVIQALDFVIHNDTLQLEYGSSITPNQKVTAAYDITQSGIPSTTALYRSTTLYSESLLPAITTGSIVLAGNKGIWSDTLTYAGGTFAWGPTTYTGGPAGLYSNIVGLFDVGGVFTTTALSAAQLTQVQRYFVRAGSPGVWELGAEIGPDPEFDNPAAWGPGAGWVVSGGKATATNISTFTYCPANFTPDLVVGGFYITDVVVDSVASGTARPVLLVGATLVNGTAFGSAGRYRQTYQAAAAYRVVALQHNSGGANLTGVFDRLSLKALTLNPAP